MSQGPPAGLGDPVDLVIVSWNGRAWLQRCLPAVAALRYPALRVIVVDNGSEDGTLPWLREAWPRVRAIDAGANLGFAAGNNLGIAAGDAPWVALLNNDTEPEPGWLGALVERGAADPRVAAVASCMLFGDRPDLLNSAGIAVDPSGIAWDRLGGAPAAAGARPARVFGASAGAALYRRAALEDVASVHGGQVLDERYFMYLEDVDLAWRLRLAGWEAAYAPEARVLHAGSGTSGEGSPFKNRLLARNKVWTLVKDYPAAGLAPRWPLVLAYDLASAPYRLLAQGQGAALRGRWEALTDLRPALRRRRAIQGARRASWAQIRAAMEPLATPLGVLRRYRHLEGRAGEAGAQTPEAGAEAGTETGAGADRA